MKKSYFLLPLLLLLTGCNFISLQGRFIERSFRKSGLLKKQAILKEDHITYWEGGNGPTLVLLHGFGADSTFAWSRQLPALAEHFHLIVPDLLWFGNSHSKNKDFTIEHQANAVYSLLASKNIFHFNLMGISYGGIIASFLMSQLPNEIPKAIIVASPGPAYTRQDYEALLKRFSVQSVNEIVLPTTRQALERLLDIAYRKPPYVPFFAQTDVLDFLKDQAGGEKSLLLKALIAEGDELKTKIKMPFPGKVLIIWGSDDKLFPLELAERLKNYFGSHAELKVIKGARHAPNVEFGRAFNQIALNFLLGMN